MVFLLWQLIQRYVYIVSFLEFTISRHTVFKPVNWMLRVKGLTWINMVCMYILVNFWHCVKDKVLSVCLSVYLHFTSYNIHNSVANAWNDCNETCSKYNQYYYLILEVTKDYFIM